MNEGCMNLYIVTRKINIEKEWQKAIKRLKKPSIANVRIIFLLLLAAQCMFAVSTSKSGKS
jgi:hypothetical protein